MRAAKLGMRLGFAPDAKVLHHVGTTTGNSPETAKRPRTPVYLNERNKLLLTRDCFPSKLPFVAGAALAHLLLKYARRGAWRQMAYGLSGWWAGLIDERGPPPWVDSK